MIGTMIGLSPFVAAQLPDAPNTTDSHQRLQLPRLNNPRP